MKVAIIIATTITTFIIILTTLDKLRDVISEYPNLPEIEIWVHPSAARSKQKHRFPIRARTSLFGFHRVRHGRNC